MGSKVRKIRKTNGPLTPTLRKTSGPMDPDPSELEALRGGGGAVAETMDVVAGLVNTFNDSGETSLDPDEMPQWAKSALPSSRAPDVSSELKVLVGKTGAGTLSEKPNTVIVPTILPGQNRATRVGGLPVGCMAVFHGPSKGGKTALALADIRTFQLHGHFAAYIDAEFSLEKLFATQLGIDNDQLIYRTPETFEETTALIADLIDNFKKGREFGKIHPDRCFIIVVDSINKLVPADELKELEKTGKGFPIRALMTTRWLDKLTPIIGNLPILFCSIAHEKIRMDAGNFQKKTRVKGGESLIYDSTLAFRVKMEKVIKTQVKVKGSGKKRGVPIGQVHRVVVEKSKVGIAFETFNFVVSNGKGSVPIGFDHAREALEEIKLRNDPKFMVVKSGKTWKCDLFPDGQIAQGEKAVAEFLHSNPQALDRIVSELNATAINAVVHVDLDDDD